MAGVPIILMMMMMDHSEAAEGMLADSDPYLVGNPAAMASSALTHAVLALCERLDELSLLAVLPTLDGEEDL